jgi:transcription antitermination protein NusB
MSQRRQGREAAIQFLFQLDLNSTPPAEAKEGFWILHEGQKNVALGARARLFAQDLIEGVNANREDIDRRITAFAQNYGIERLAVVDRNILRLAIFELLHKHDLAPGIVINEAIEIAKKYGGEKSGKFINGILDRIRIDIGRTRPTPKPTPKPTPDAGTAGAEPGA